MIKGSPSFGGKPFNQRDAGSIRSAVPAGSVTQGGGWVGMESGRDPRKGYFEFANGRFELADSPDQRETDRLLEELSKYEEEINDAYMQAEIDSDKDFEKLSQLLKENLYSWWD